MAKFHGRATIRFNGLVIETDDDATLKVGGIKNNPRQVGNSFNYNQTKIPSQMTCKVGVSKNVSLAALQAMAEAEIQFESDCGKVFIIRDGCQTGELEFTGGADGGTTELTINGSPAEEMTI